MTMSVASWIVLSLIGLMLILGVFSWWDDRVELRELRALGHDPDDPGAVALQGRAA